MLSKQKLLDFLEREIASCEIVGNASDMAIKSECQRIIDKINAGLFDEDEKSHNFIVGELGKGYGGDAYYKELMGSWNKVNAIKITLKSGGIKEINPLEIKFINPGLFDCKIHMENGTVYEIEEDFSSIKKRIAKEL